ncbi:MAG: hypothetical protein RIC35_24100 [Marinoscillum sp.]
MKLWPSREHTIVTGFTKADLLTRIANYTQEVGSAFITEKPLFNGKVSENGFRISTVVKTPQNALPLIIGQLEETSHGSILFLKMKLFPAAVLFLRAFTLLSVVIGMILFLMANLRLAGLISFGLGALNYLILTTNFHKHAQRSVSQLEELLEGPKQ